MEERPQFRSDDGQYLTQSLFLENSYHDTRYAIYTWKHHDHELNGKRYKSFPKLYLEIADPTEYLVATTLFEGWAHWERILGNALLAAKVEPLRTELSIKLRSEGVRALINEAKMGGRGAGTAAKWLADKGWDSHGPGRPSNARIKQEARELNRIQQEVSKDAERMKEFLNK